MDKKIDVVKIKEMLKDTTKEVLEKANSAKLTAEEKVVKILDANSNGKIDIEDIITLGLQIPGVRIHREEFLRKEFFKNHSKEQIDCAITHTPAYAKISPEEIDKIADEVIKFERSCTAGMAAVLGVPGGFAMIAAIPADLLQYYGYMLRTAQKLMYLYGFPEIDIKEDGKTFDTETLNTLIICLGVMHGVAGAGKAIKAMAKALAIGVEKKLLKAALTKGTIYPIVRNVAKWFGKKMTKEVFAGFFKKAIPVVGGVIGGGITYFSFKPCCDKLKNTLRDTLLSNPDYIDVTDDIIIANGDFIDVYENE